MAKTLTKKENKNTICYHAFIEIGYSFGFENNDRGLPISGEIYAENDADAMAKATAYGKKIADNMFDNSVINNEISKSVGTTFCIPHSLQLLKVEVKQDYLIDSWGDAHNATLRDILNNVWSHTEYRKKFKEIIRAYWERDKEELADVFSDECIWWHLADLSFEDACKEVKLETICEAWCHHVADDEDLRCVIDFIRPRDLYPNLDWYKA